MTDHEQVTEADRNALSRILMCGGWSHWTEGKSAPALAFNAAVEQFVAETARRLAATKTDEAAQIAMPLPPPPSGQENA